jgi:predicted transcriptional regulator
MIRNRDAEDTRIVLCILRQPGITFGELLTQAALATSTLRYHLLTLELTGEIRCERERNRNRYFMEVGKT